MSTGPGRLAYGSEVVSKRHARHMLVIYPLEKELDCGGKALRFGTVVCFTSIFP